MKDKITLKEFTDGLYKDGNVIKNLGMGLKLAEKLIELEAIENYINMIYGVELEIYVKPTEVKAGRFYGKSYVELLNEEKLK